MENEQSIQNVERSPALLSIQLDKRGPQYLNTPLNLPLLPLHKNQRGKGSNACIMTEFSYQFIKFYVANLHIIIMYIWFYSVG